MEEEEFEQDALKDAKREAERTKILSRLIRRFHYQLNKDRQVREYLTDERLLKHETIEKFRLGACPTLETLLQDFSEYDLRTAGIAKLDDDGHLVNKFQQNRLIIPIYDAHSRPIAVIGRFMGQEDERAKAGVAKYVNTVFSKTSCLFGLNLAYNAIRKKEAVLVVEGNFDVISAVQAGVENVVGSSGAFFSPTQATILARYANRVWLGLDDDEAGRKATERVLARPQPEGLLIKKQAVPAGFKDWDEYFRSKLK